VNNETVCSITAHRPNSITLDRALNSVKNQTRALDEVLTKSDNGKLGPSPAWNQLLNESSSEWVSMLEDDDWWHPNYIERVSQKFENYDVVVAGRGTYEYSGAQLGVALEGGYAICPGSGLSFRREAALAVGGFDEDITQQHAYLILIKLHLAGFRMAYVTGNIWTRTYHTGQLGRAIGHYENLELRHLLLKRYKHI